MNAVTTLGIDMSSQPKGPAGCAITWEADKVVVMEPQLGCDDERLAEMIARSDAVGIDAPITVPALPRSIGFGLTLFSMFEKVKFGCEQASNIYLFEASRNLARG